MSFAWETTTEDISTVLQRHGITTDVDTVLASYFDQDGCARVERAVLAYTDFDDQCQSALDEIETILMEIGVLAGAKVFKAP